MAWGPWIAHDGDHVPNLGALFVDAFVVPYWVEAQTRAWDAPLMRVQFRADEIHDDNWLVDRNDCALICRYRIGKPRGLVMLEELLADLPEGVDA